MRSRIGLAAFASVMVLAALGPALFGSEFPLLALIVRSFFSGLCHQRLERTLLLNGTSVAICVRCLGIYIGAAVGAVFSLAICKRERVKESNIRYAFCGMVLLNVLDMVTESLHAHGNLPLLRFSLGMLLGIGASVLLSYEGSAVRLGEAIDEEP